MALRILHIGGGVRGRHWLKIVRDYPEAISVGLVEPSPLALRGVKNITLKFLAFKAYEAQSKQYRRMQLL